MKDRFIETNSHGIRLVCDKRTDLIWQKDYTTNKKWREAIDYAETANTQRYGGYDDWRLPTVHELATLINYDRHDPASDFPGMPSKCFWSSSSHALHTSDAWYVYGYNGSVCYNDKTYDYAARCVRGERR